MTDYLPTDDVEAPLSFTGKIDGNLMTVRGNDVDQFLGRVDEFIEKGAVAKVAEFSALCNAAGTVAQTFSGNGGGQRPAQRQQAPAQQGAPSADAHPEGLTCSSCGQTVIYKKINKGSRSFELWVCPNQKSRNDGHHSEFIN